MTNTIDRYDFEQAIENLPYESIDAEYSGRGMFGSVCVGVVLPGSAVLQVSGALQKQAAHLREEAEEFSLTEYEVEQKVIDDQIELAEKLERMTESMSTDNMGLDMIVYFPSWEFE